VDGANVHNVTLTDDTLIGVIAKRPKREGFEAWRFEAGKGYDSLEVRFLVAFYGCSYSTIGATLSRLKSKSKTSC